MRQIGFGEQRVVLQIVLIRFDGMIGLERCGLHFHQWLVIRFTGFRIRYVIGLLMDGIVNTMSV